MKLAVNEKGEMKRPILSPRLCRWGGGEGKVTQGYQDAYGCPKEGARTETARKEGSNVL